MNISKNSLYILGGLLALILWCSESAAGTDLDLKTGDVGIKTDGESQAATPGNGPAAKFKFPTRLPRRRTTTTTESTPSTPEPPVETTTTTPESPPSTVATQDPSSTITPNATRSNGTEQPAAATITTGLWNALNVWKLLY